MAAEPRHLRLYGLQITDAAEYLRYRAAMMPILARHGGAFGYDFVVGEVLKSYTPERINRVFTMSFPGHHSAERFFSDPAYLVARARHFERAVESVTTIANFEQ
jgi:uncharacterized protein (DUF1330 family)